MSETPERWELRPAFHLIGTPHRSEVDAHANIFGVETGRIIALTVQRRDAEQIVHDHNTLLDQGAMSGD